MNSSLKDEKKLLRYTYFFCLICFLNISLLKDPFDVGSLVMFGVICFLMGYSHFILRKFFPDGDKYLLIFACILSSIGIVILYRLNPTYAVKQIVWFIAGIAVFILIVVLLPELKKYDKYKYVYMVICLIFMAMATFKGTEKNGSRNWVYIGSLGFQPSEFGKIFFVAYLAAALKKYKNFKQLIEPAFVVMVSLGFMVLQNDLGSALLFFVISITMLYIATGKKKYIVVCFILFAIGAVISYKLFAHVRLRVEIWQHPWIYKSNKSYQLVQSMYAIAWGGLFGTGLGLGYPQFVPVSESDFIFSAVCEEMGALMGYAIMILYFLLFYRCMRAAVRAEDNFSRLLAVGYSAMIGSEVIIIVGGVTGMIPLTGITLPLISAGGSSMIMIFVALGILQKISEGGR
ncbi:FtsW/RodA/SpoVE family cell cycle protein [Clostridium felsineum]|uniref:FtsW-like protein n=1 Tax=Clostridium felsineum TaxID=36839 RepID=A0A1S8M7D6_9CLOT|nr:FtsW/RodA/SpoVE family cell cycle protein [Clostridium felsineum]MCR3760540.1 FtsW/RodA/SpoVE family cell cycle protein [Clostridium felsineum]URZ05121.1 putative FtsW-like protein [Clostridium felsineum]URZ10162.1 putative FtsW-like protein [Clostridium felsineum]URZ17942.1 putative FtsW-like protein [Clostridium felsineum DSM 794]